MEMLLCVRVNLIRSVTRSECEFLSQCVSVSEWVFVHDFVSMFDCEQAPLSVSQNIEG